MKNPLTRSTLIDQSNSIIGKLKRPIAQLKELNEKLAAQIESNKAASSKILSDFDQKKANLEEQIECLRVKGVQDREVLHLNSRAVEAKIDENSKFINQFSFLFG